MDIPYLSKRVAGDVFVAQINGSQSGTYSAVSPGWVKLFEEFHPSSPRKQILFCKTSDGTETGSAQFAQGFNTGTALYSMHLFSNTPGCPNFYVNATLNTGTASPWEAPTLTTTADNQLAVAFGWLDNHITNGTAQSWSGETGGNWLQESWASQTTFEGTYIQLQVAAMPTQGTISGGSDDFTPTGTGGMNWANRSFVILGGSGGQASPATKEYIRLGERIVAIEQGSP